MQQLFASGSLRVYTTDDVVGVEVGGALKNVFAIAGESYSLVSSNTCTRVTQSVCVCGCKQPAGISEGMGLGVNSLAALVTRGCSEMMQLAKAMGARPSTLAGLFFIFLPSCLLSSSFSLQWRVVN